MRPITGMTTIAFIYTAITSQWMKAYNEITQMINLINVAPESVPNISKNIWKYVFTIFMKYTNKPILLFSLALLIVTLITKAFQTRDDINLA